VQAEVQQALSLYGRPVARVMLAAVFLYSGQDKLRHWQAGVAEVSNMGLPLPSVFAAATIVTQLLGGLSLAVDFWAPAGAVLLAFFTVAVTVLGHPFWRLQGNAPQQALTTSLEHVAIVGGLLLVVVHAL
jgi:putative oxidoreductase